MPLEFVSWMTFIYLDTWVDCVVIITFCYVVLHYVTLRDLLTRSCFKGGLWSCVRAERTNDVTASAPHSRILAWECWHTYRNKHVIVSWNVFSVNVETKKSLPPKDVPSAVSTRRVRGGGYLNLSLTVWPQQRERVPENNGTWWRNNHQLIWSLRVKKPLYAKENWTTIWVSEVSTRRLDYSLSISIAWQITRVQPAGVPNPTTE